MLITAEAANHIAAVVPNPYSSKLYPPPETGCQVWGSVILHGMAGSHFVLFKLCSFLVVTG